MVPGATVICTFLDAEDTIEPTLESLHRQATGEARFILVDDGSTDGSAAVAETFARRDPRFSCVRNPDPGRGRALNLGVALSDTEYVAVLDADDVAHPAWLADGIATLRCRSEFAVVGFERAIIRGQEQPAWESVDREAGTDVVDVTRDLARANVLAHSGTVMRKRQLVEIGGYNAARSRLFDYDLWIRFAEAGRRLGVCRRVRIAKRYHEGQKFSRGRGYDLAAWREQFRAIMAIDRDYRNFMHLGLRVAGDITRRPRRAIAAGVKRR